MGGGRQGATQLVAGDDHYSAPPRGFQFVGQHAKARGLFKGEADVVVTDGSGATLPHQEPAEGVAEFVFQSMRGGSSRGIPSRPFGGLLDPAPKAAGRSAAAADLARFGWRPSYWVVEKTEVAVISRRALGCPARDLQWRSRWARDAVGWQGGRHDRGGDTSKPLGSTDPSPLKAAPLVNIEAWLRNGERA